jgi:hypothetical protein
MTAPFTFARARLAAVVVLQFLAARLGLVVGCARHPTYHGARQRPRPAADGSLCPTCQLIHRANQ